MTADPGRDRPCADCGDDVGPVEYTDTEGRPLCNDCIEDADEGWECPRCGYRTDGMSLADRDTYAAHLADHQARAVTARRVCGLVYGPLA